MTFYFVRQAGWYANMRRRLRTVFGGLGDLFADLLGATSSNTPVRENWKYAVDAVRGALDGRFDRAMPDYIAWTDAVRDAEEAAAQYLNDAVA